MCQLVSAGSKVVQGSQEAGEKVGKDTEIEKKFQSRERDSN